MNSDDKSYDNIYNNIKKINQKYLKNVLDKNQLLSTKSEN
jgi:hypothetical protein